MSFEYLVSGMMQYLPWVSEKLPQVYLTEVAFLMNTFLEAS